MKLTQRKKVKADIASQIDWGLIAEKQKDPREFHAFLQKGQELLRLGRILQEV